MNYNEFVCTMLKDVKRELGTDVTVEVREVYKNNGVLLKGLTITSKESNMSPTIYLNGFYEEFENGKGMDELRNAIIEIYTTSRIQGTVDMNFFLDFEQVKSNLYCRLINYDKNTEFLTNVPYQRHFDLATICYFTCEQEHLRNGFITITMNHLDGWGISEKELFQYAMANTLEKYPYLFFSMEQLLRQMIEADVRKDRMPEVKVDGKSDAETRAKTDTVDECYHEEQWIQFTVDEILKGVLGDKKRTPMYVLTTEGKTWGAISMLNNKALSELANLLESDLFILPSSVHEVIIVPADNEESAETLQAMVADINRTHVDPEEVLSDHIYRYLRDTKATILQ